MLISFLQKVLYAYGITSPLIIAAMLLSWYKSNVILYWQIIVLTISGLALIYHWFFITIVTKKLSKEDFRATGTPEEKDSFAWSFLATYVAPIIELSLSFSSINLPKFPYSLFLAAIAFVVALVSNQAYGSPIYLIQGYHFHTVESESGKNFVLMSKRKNYRNSKQLRTVIVLFENLLIEVG